MGIYDRDYMRKPSEEPRMKKPRARIEKADNKPTLIKRLKFWFWNLKNK
jgi:hypothetical protein